MNIKDILAQGLIDGVGEFFDSIVEQINEQTEQSLDATLDMYEETLKEIQELLKTIGGDGKFDKFDDVGELCGWTLIVASVVSGKGLEETEFESLRQIRDNSFDNLFDSWKQARVFLESEICSSPLTILENKLGMSDLDVILDSFFDDVLALSYIDKGIFAIRKTRKMIQLYSKRVYMACEIYGMLINVMRNVL